MKLYDAARCPYCARVRIALALKGIPYETVTIDLRDRPAWLYDLNVLGKVPVLEEDGFVLPESDVIMAYLDELQPSPALLPADLHGRAAARLAVFRFDDTLGDDYYAFRRGDENDLTGKLAALDLGRSLFVDVAYAPWVVRARDMLGVELPPHVQNWLARAGEQPAFAAEIETVRSL